VEKVGQRRRRYYRITAEGRRVLASQRNTWRTFVTSMRLITGVDNA
jgi:DNA-binding PadR family transcriptional regulator